MGKYANTQIKESDEELKSLHSKHKEERIRKRINMLRFLKESKFKTRQALADELRVGKRTLERWINIYLNEGLGELLSPIRRNRKSSFISPQAHKALQSRLTDAQSPFTSYKEIQDWLNEEYNTDIKYNNLYYYLTKHFKTKLKIPRKSNVKKDEQAVAFFKNTQV